jgi:hypothetical protein
MMLQIVLVSIAVLSAISVGAVLMRASGARLVQVRQDRLKAHLDWVNPEPVSSRRRRPIRR